MKKTFSLLLACLLAVACSGNLIEHSQEVVLTFDNLLATDTKAAVKLWDASGYKPAQLQANIDNLARKIGNGANTAQFEVMNSKLYKTWVFSGTIYKDAVEVDIKIVIPPKPPEKGDLIAPQPVVFRQLSYVVEIDGQLLIVESQMSEVK